MYDILTGYLATSSWSCLLSRILEFIVFDELILFLLLIGIVCEWIFNHAVQNGQDW